MKLISFCIVLTYFLFSFFMWDYNIAHWGWIARVLFIISSFAFLVFCLICVAISNKSKTDEKLKEIRGENEYFSYSSFQQRLTKLAEDRGYKQ